MYEWSVSVCVRTVRSKMTFIHDFNCGPQKRRRLTLNIKKMFVFLVLISHANIVVCQQNDSAVAPWWFSEKPFGKDTIHSKLEQNVSPQNTGSDISPWWFLEGLFNSHTPTQNPLADGKRISIRKCEEFSRLVSTTVQAHTEINVPKCEFNFAKLVIGGIEAELKEFPHMAALRYNYTHTRRRWKCGGSLISELYVLTAAHCISKLNQQPKIVRLGDLNLKRKDDGANPMDYGVVEWITHPNYNKRVSLHNNDIGLLKLERPVNFNEFIRPACLYTKDSFQDKVAVATGWGLTSPDGKKSDHLLKVPLTLADDENAACRKAYAKIDIEIISSMFCAGERDGGKDTCQGDSGGPLQISKSDNQCVYSIIGVTSFGKSCAEKEFPGVYTKVSAFLPWIEHIVWPNL